MGVKHSEIDNLPGGVLPINKPVGVTSHDIVGRVRRLYGTKRVGHAGTLDPLAEGVLLLLVGRAAKACEYISSDRKVYTATLKLGLVTDTEDITGEVLERHEGELPTEGEVLSSVTKFQGKIMQIPPMYSALKVDGQKLYELARRGVTVERQAREVEIFGISAAATGKSDEYILRVECSGGTYIRTLCADIGAALGCGGVMAALRRDEACGVALCDTHTTEEIEGLDIAVRNELLMPVEWLFRDLDEVRLSPFYERLFYDGCPIYQKKIKSDFKVGQRLRVLDSKGEFFALGEVGEYPDGDAVKSVKIFRLK